MKPIQTGHGWEIYFDAMRRFARLYADELSKPGREAQFYGACRIMDELFQLGDSLTEELECALESIGLDPRDFGFDGFGD